MTDVEPNLPGWRLKPPPPPSFTRPRTLTLAKTPAGGYATVAAVAASPATAGTSLHFKADHSAPTTPPPRYVALAGLVLRWFGHFSEVVPAGLAADGERVRVRRVEVRLHLVDETVDVLERRVPNSGLSQGLLSGRAPLAIPTLGGGRKGGAPSPPRRAGPADFPPLGGVLKVAGRAVTLTDADGFTRAWLAENAGVTLGPALTTPVGDAETAAAAAAAVAAAAAAAARPRRARRPADAAVLSFTAAWEEATATDGPPPTHAATLRFYVADGTVEVVGAKSGGGGGGGGGPAPTTAAAALAPSPGGGRVFLRRCLLPKPVGAAAVGAPTAALPRPAVTDAIGSPGGLLGARAAAAAAALAAGGDASPPQPFVTAADLRVGAAVDVLGRPFRLLACADGPTRAWLRDVADVAEADLAPLAPPPPPAPRPRPALPPHTPACFGSDADSARSCGPRLVPRAPVRRAPSDADARAVLSFSAVLAAVRGGGGGGGGGSGEDEAGAAAAATPLAPPHPDAGRRFTLCFYPADGALAVFETPGDGFPGGRALERAPVKRPACVCGGGGGGGGGGVSCPPPPPPGGGACGACGGTARRAPPSAAAPPSPPPEAGLPSTATHYVEADLFIGAALRLHGRTFLLTAAHEGTLRRLESRGGGGGGVAAAGWASRAGALSWARGTLEAAVPGGRAAAGPRLRAALAAAILQAGCGGGGGGAEAAATPARRGTAAPPSSPPPSSPPDAVTPGALAAAIRSAVGGPVSPPAPHVWVALWRALAGGPGGAAVPPSLAAADAVARLVE